MGVAEWARLTLDRIGTNMKLTLERDEDDLLVDDDPIGEFLSRKASGAYVPEDEEVSAEGEVVAEPENASAEGQEAEEAEPMVVKLQEDTEATDDAIVAPAVNESEALESGDEGGEKEVTVSADGGAPEEEEARGDVSAQTAADEKPLVSEAELSEDDPTAEKNMAETLHGLDTMEREESQQDDDVDSLLDVFKEEQFSDSPINRLSKDLADVDVHSLLEETKGIANMVRKTPT